MGTDCSIPTTGDASPLREKVFWKVILLDSDRGPVRVRVVSFVPGCQ